MEFKDWLEKEELLAWFLEEDILTEAGLLQRLGKMRYTLPFLALPFISGQTTPVPPQQITQSQQINQFSPLIDAIEKKYGVTISPSQIKMMRPADVLNGVWGKDWGYISKRAKVAQNLIPGTNDAAVTDVEKLNTPIPVINTDPNKFKIQKLEPNANGFCANIYYNGQSHKFCVSKNFDPETLRHELRHTTQNTIIGTTIGDENVKDLLNRYFLKETELGVRLAEMKSNYYQLTGKIATSDQQSMKEMLNHFLKNYKQYNPDVQQMYNVIQESNRRGMLEKLLQYLLDNVEKVVVNQQANKQTLA